MSRLINRVGQVFGKLIVLARGPDYVGPSGKRKVTWICLCECGQIATILSCNLTRGLTTSCGCVRKEVSRLRVTTHGMRKSRVYNIWCGMIARCKNPNNPAWDRYGGRGITVCERWLIFENFLADMGEPPDGMSIDRIDNSRGYEPGNCRWATEKQQQRGRRNNRQITWKEKTQPLATWAEELEIEYSTLWSRLNSGWSVEHAFTTPCR